MSDPVRERYERHPYPPVSALALPARGEGRELSYERGRELAGLPRRSHEGARILVAGAGTLEALGVAQAHPRAREVVALDVSERSLTRLGRRLWLARAAGRKLAPLRLERGDLRDWGEPGSFDLVLASNVLHHLDDPAGALGRLARLLAPEGLLRAVTYPKASRLWMRETSAWLRANGLGAETPGLVRRCRQAVEALEPWHPIRSCFESQPERGLLAGLLDAFFHPLERPLSPLEWRAACASASLECFAEAQTETSRSGFLAEVAPEASALDRWERLQVLDDLLELCANPAFWLRKGSTCVGAPAPAPASTAENSLGSWLRAGLLPSRARCELGAGLRRARALLARHGLELGPVLEALKREVGPRTLPSGRVLPGLSISEYDAESLLRLPDWDADGARKLGGRLEGVPGGSLEEQVDWVQGRLGPLHDRIPVSWSPRP